MASIFRGFFAYLYCRVAPFFPSSHCTPCLGGILKFLQIPSFVQAAHNSANTAKILLSHNSANKDPPQLGSTLGPKCNLEWFPWLFEVYSQHVCRGLIPPDFTLSHLTSNQNIKFRVPFWFIRLTLTQGPGNNVLKALWQAIFFCQSKIACQLLWCFKEKHG